ncbi:histidinol-phosphatase HisJ [Amorphoplanes nipponensis]|uniref:Histidinol-phosphatase n=1 Tax=Actinoplanes nipponensis TaxID=135950 RepID=A0A919JAE9_9ACTN|nr:histidinol-phosphatase [Actinoplanes nipponensis]GIE47068.1 histidinol-phosphatase [Actinoplanes nipponensis]
MGDYHVHLHPHVPRPDSPPPGVYPEDYVDAFVETALSRGATEVGFTEHLHRFVDFEPAVAGFWNVGPRADLTEHSRTYYYDDLNLRLDRYVAAVLGARDRGLPVRLGMEVDFFPAHLEKMTAVLRQYPFDYLIGSVHWIDAWSVDHPAVAYEFERRGVRRAYEDYFGLVADLAESGLVQVLAHPDVVKKFGHRCPEEPVDLYRKVVDAARRGGVAMEVSSAGLRYPVGEPYPSPALLRMSHQAGIPITLASDAHYPDQAADQHMELVRYARAAGYRHQLAFRVGGAAHLVALPDPDAAAPTEPTSSEAGR